MFRTRTV